LIFKKNNVKYKKKERGKRMKSYSILDYGAKICDTPQTKEIQSAIDACFLAGGGRVIVPCGVYLTGGIRLRSGVQLYLESGAILKGSRNPEDYLSFLEDEIEPVKENEILHDQHPYTYATSRWNNGLIRAIDAENISVIGEKGSYLDGSNVYDPLLEDGYRGPHGISLWRCKGVHFEGYTVIHSGNWAHAIFESEDITVKRVTVYGGHDGVDIRGCDRVLIENCLLHTGDDSVAGYDNCDVVVRNCDLKSGCNIFRFGGNNVLIENCKTDNPCEFAYRGHLSDEKKKMGELTDESCRHRALNVLSYFCDYRIKIRKTPGNIVFRNCEFRGITRFFRMPFGQHKWCDNRPLTSITFENCAIVGMSDPSIVLGDEKEKISFVLKNCRFGMEAGAEDLPFLTCKNFSLLSLENVEFENFTSPTIILASEGEVKVKGGDAVQFKKEASLPS
jgi:hypothetical protein